MLHEDRAEVLPVDYLKAGIEEIIHECLRHLFPASAEGIAEHDRVDLKVQLRRVLNLDLDLRIRQARQDLRICRAGVAETQRKQRRRLDQR